MNRTTWDVDNSERLKLFIDFPLEECKIDCSLNCQSLCKVKPAAHCRRTAEPFGTRQYRSRRRKGTGPGVTVGGAVSHASGCVIRTGSWMAGGWGTGSGVKLELRLTASRQIVPIIITTAYQCECLVHSQYFEVLRNVSIWFTMHFRSSSRKYTEIKNLLVQPKGAVTFKAVICFV